MADPHDVAATKAARREFSKRQLDITMCDIRVSHGVVYVRGVIKPIRGGPSDLNTEVERIARILRQQPSIRDVVIDAILRS